MIFNSVAAGGSSGGNQYTITVTVTAGATVTATNGTSTVTGTSVGGTCVLTVTETGTWSVSATLNGQTSGTQTVQVTDDYPVQLYFVDSTLNNNSWAAIRYVSDSGLGASFWAVGDRKAVTLNGTVGHCTFSNYSAYVFILGFDHNASLEGSNRIHFQFAKTAVSGGTDVCFTDSSYNTAVSATGYFSLNSSNTNVGGWSSSQMRNTICGTSLSSYAGTMIDVIPSDLRAVLKTVTKYTDNTGNSSTSAAHVTATTDVIFLLAEYEVFGTVARANTNESAKQAQYAYYSAGNSKVKNQHTATSTAAYWWLRSPYSGNATSFVLVNTSGSVTTAAANHSRGFAPGFCV